MLTTTQLAARDGKLTASRVGIIMNGDIEALLNLWRELVGDPDWQPEDLSAVWAVQLGNATEQLNLDWFARKHGDVIRRGEVVTHANGWCACTLDGWSTLHCCPIETKHVGGREPLEVVIDRYQPQMHWQMLVTGAPQCALSIIMGASEPIVEFIPRHDDYAAELWQRAETFMAHVRNMTEPVIRPPIIAPAPSIKIYDMAGSNAWASAAATWLENRAARKQCEAAEKELKELTPADAARCHGHSVESRRDRAGRLTLRKCP